MKHSRFSHFFAINQTLVAVVVAAFVAFSSFLLLQNYTQLTVKYLSLEGRFPVGMEYTVEFIGPFNNSYTTSNTVKESGDSLPQRIGTPAKNLATRSLVITFQFSDETPESAFIDLHSVQLFRPYLTDIFISQRHIKTLFDSEHFSAEGRASIIPGADGKAVLSFNQSLTTQFNIAYLILAVFIGFAVFLLIKNTNWKQIPAFRDMNLGNKISSSHEFNSVNGLRGIAALLVLFSHTAPGFKAIEMGIALLFVFSGFLLSKPFVINPQKIFSWPTIEQFLIKRLKRILPLYYSYFFFVFLLNHEFESLIRNFLFVEANGHLWPMSQILTFYMMLPLILLITCGLYRLHRILPLVILVFATIMWTQFATEWRPYYSGSRHVIFNLHAFLIGVIGAYLQYEFMRNWQSAQAFIKRHAQPLAVVAALSFFFILGWSAPLQAPLPLIQFLFGHFYFKCALSVFIIMFTLNLEGTWYNALICNRLLRSIGVIGFSFYVWHSAGMYFILEFQSQVLGIAEPLERSWGLTIGSFVVTYLMAVISYSWIERPFFGYRERKLSSPTSTMA